MSHDHIGVSRLLKYDCRTDHSGSPLTLPHRCTWQRRRRRDIMSILRKLADSVRVGMLRSDQWRRLINEHDGAAPSNFNVE
jgi:hypothetical protein